MNDITLAGCTPTPLASYLKALGIFRLVAEQKDAEVKGYWRCERFVLVTGLMRDELTRFFVDEYRPTPIISPWNGRAGYLEGDDADNSTRRGPELLRIFRASQSTRLSPYRDLIAGLDGLDLIKEMNEVRAKKKDLEKDKKAHPNDWPEEKQKQLASAIKRDALLKEQQLKLLRNILSDDQLAWLDAAAAIGQERAFAPLLGGSGGVEGSMDLGVNFMDNLLLLIASDGSATDDSRTWLDSALHGMPVRLTAKNTAGSLAPERVGGHNATSGFSQYLNINPWDYVLMIEGAVTFKPSLTRKLESTGHARLSYPFAVEPSFAGTGATSSTDEKRTRAGSSEVWMPLWPKPANHFEVVALLREGNVRLGAKAPRDGLDMARCIARLGVDRGIRGFQRYLFLKRSGDNDLAVPLNRFDVSRSGAPNADLIADLDRAGFLDRLRREARDKDAPASLKRAVAQLESSLFALARPGGGRQAIQRVLMLLGEVTQALAVSRKGREAVPMLPRLSESWVLQANDDSAEFRVALGLASLTNLPAYLAPVAWIDKNRRWEWQPESRSFVWGKGDLIRNLVRVVERRVIEAQGQETEPFACYARLGTCLADTEALLSGHIDDGRIAALLHGLIWADLPEALSPTVVGERFDAPLPIAYALLKPFFAPHALLKYLGRLPEDARLPLPRELLHLLATGDLQKAEEIAWHRARIAGLGWPRGDAPRSGAVNGARLLAALAVPIKPAALAHILPRAEDPQTESI
jgi:CRISPR-associated protein Csx17